MSRLSEERIRKLWIETSCIVPTCDHYKHFTRAIEREAYKQGQEDIQKRVIDLTNIIGVDWNESGDINKFYATEYLAACFRNLEIEEPK